MRRSVTSKMPGKVLVIYSAVEPAERGEAHDITTDLEAVETAAVVAENLRTLGYDAQIHEITALEDVNRLLDAYDPDQLLIFNLCEHLGRRSSGESEIAARMEDLGIHYTGTPPWGLMACLDKAQTKNILETYDILTPPYGVFARSNQPSCVAFPAIVKPLTEDASLGISRESVVFDEAMLQKRVQYVLDVYQQPALVEEYIVGREFNISVWGNDSVQVLPLAELSFEQWSDPYQQFCHFDVKWTPESLEYQTMPVICPASVDEVVAARIRATARRAYSALGCCDYGRVDIRLRDGIPYVLEVNPNPCLAPDAGVANAARVAGYDYPIMVSQIVKLAWERCTQRESSRC